MSEKPFVRVRIGSVIGILIISGLILLIIPFVALRWSANPFAGFFLDPNLVVSAGGEPDFFGKQLDPQITYPHRVLAIDDTPIATNQDFYRQLKTYEVNQAVIFTFEWQPLDGTEMDDEAFSSEREIPIPLGKLDAGDLWNQFWLFYICAVIIFAIGVWAFWVRPFDEAPQVFAVLTAVGAVSIATIFDQVTSQQFLKLWVFLLPLSGGFLLWLTLIYPHETRWLEKRPFMRWLLLAVGIGIGIWGVLWLGHDDPRAYVVPWRFGFVLNGVSIVISLITMAYRGTASPSTIVRQQGRVIFLSGLVAFLPLTIFFLLSFSGIQMPWLTTTFYIPLIIIFPFAIAYTIVRYGLLDMKMVRRGVAYAVLTALLVLIFAIIATGVTATFGSLAESPWFIAGAVVFVALLFEPLRSRIQAGLDQMFFRRSVTLEGLQRAYNRELLTAVDFEQVVHLLLNYIDQGIPETKTALYFLNNQEGVYRDFTNPNEISVRVDSDFVAFMAEQTNSLDLSEERTWPDVVRSNPILLKEKDVSLLVPLNGQNALLGWLAMSKINGRAVIAPNEMSYVTSLVDQSLLGLERASVVRQLEDRVTELDQLSTFSQFLAFTIEPEDLFELVFTNNQRLLDIDDFFIALRNPDTGTIYNAFYVENDQRLKEKEGQHVPLTEQQVCQAIKSGQIERWIDSTNRSWVAAPLNVGAETLGAVYTVTNKPDEMFGPQQERLFLTYAQRTAVALERLQTNQRITEQAQRLQIINQVTLSLADTLELDPLLDLIMNKAIELFDAQAGSLLLVDHDTGELVFEIVRGPAEAELLKTRLPLGAGIAGTAAQTARSIITNDVSEDKRWFSEVDEDTDFHTRSILTVPLLRNNRVLGVLQVINKGKNGALFDDHDERLLNSFASQAVVALENARLVEQTDQKLQTSVEELSLLQQLDRDLNASLALETVLNITLDRMLTILNGTAGAIMLKDMDGLPQLRAWRRYDSEFDPQSVTSQMLLNGSVGKVIASGKPLIVNNVHEEAGYIRANFDTMSQMVLPLNHKQELIGTVVIESETLDRFTDEDRETAVRITNHAAIAIANALLYEQVMAANQAKSEFVSMVSHELKTPMTAIRGYVDLMLTGLTGELSTQQTDFLETISANISRMGQQIQDLTDISRIETNRLHMELEFIQLQDVMDMTLKTVGGLCDEKSIKLNIDLPENLPDVEADKSRLVQVMTNLISNACKYSPEKTAVNIRFETGIHHKTPSICVAVQDQGYGISPDDQQKLFTKFFRSDDPNIRQAKGTGLGLSITKGIVELHGGDMWLESAIGQGTTFFFSLPIEQA